MKPVKVLIIDDNADLRETLNAELVEEGEWEVEGQGFEDLGETLGRFRPDMVVLDILDGPVENGQDTGNTSFDQIRKTWFCPVVVYSAFPEKQNFSHPLVKTVTKGANTESEVRNFLTSFISEAKMIRGVHQDFDGRIREALRDSVQVLREQIGAPEDGLCEGILPRAVRRLVAARVDAGSSGEGKLRAWERFVVPPLGNHLLTADLLSSTSADEALEEENFRLVLTPSCDLVPRSNGSCNAKHILVACCEKIGKLGNIELPSGRCLSSGMKNALRPILTEGMTGHLLPIPGFRGRVPLMVANLRRLELLEHDQVQLEPSNDQESLDGRFRRVVSTDSPFREMVVWAYLRVTGRPGLPEIDVEGWLEDISHHLERRPQR